MQTENRGGDSHHGRRAAPPGPCPSPASYLLPARDLFEASDPPRRRRSRRGLHHPGPDEQGFRTINAQVNLSGGLALPYNNAMDAVTLPPELEANTLPRPSRPVATGISPNWSQLACGFCNARTRPARSFWAFVSCRQAENFDREGLPTGDEVAERVRATIARKASATA